MAAPQGQGRSFLEKSNKSTQQQRIHGQATNVTGLRFTHLENGQNSIYHKGCFDDLNKGRSTDGLQGQGPAQSMHSLMSVQIITGLSTECALLKCPYRLLSSGFSPWHLAPTSCQSLLWRSCGPAPGLHVPRANPGPDRH